MFISPVEMFSFHYAFAPPAGRLFVCIFFSFLLLTRHAWISLLHARERKLLRSLKSCFCNDDNNNNNIYCCRRVATGKRG